MLVPMSQLYLHPWYFLKNPKEFHSQAFLRELHWLLIVSHIKGKFPLSLIRQHIWIKSYPSSTCTYSCSYFFCPFARKFGSNNFRRMAPTIWNIFFSTSLKLQMFQSLLKNMFRQEKLIILTIICIQKHYLQSF